MYSTATSDKVKRTAQAAIFTQFEGVQTQASLSDFVTVMDTEDAMVDFGWLGAVPMPSEWVSEPIERAVKNYDHRIRVKKWYTSVGFAQELAEDDKTGTVIQRAQAVGARARTHVNKFAAQVLEAGSGTTVGTAYDARPFFDTAHAESGTSQVNTFTHAAVDQDDPTVAEAQALVEKIVEGMSILTDDQGEPFNIDIYDNLEFVIPVNLRFVFNQLLGGNGTIGGGVLHPNDNTGTNGQMRGFKFRVNPYLTSGVKIYGLLKNLPGTVAPLILVNRIPWDFQVFDRFNSVEHAKHDRISYFGRARYGMGYGAWQAAALGTFVP